MIGNTGRTVIARGLRNRDDFVWRALDRRRRRTDDGVMCSGETEDAVRARHMGRCTDGKGGRGAAVVQAQFESRRSITGRSRQCKTAERDQQALGGNRVGDGDRY